MGIEDERVERMDLGLGVWTDRTHRYYSMDRVIENDNGIFDGLDGRRLLIYMDPTTRIPAAVYTDATGFAWEDDVLRLNNGHVIRDATLFDENGERLEMPRPLQLFTRWYGFAMTFPGVEVWDGN